jgi:anti-anti-sigma factor
MSNVTVPYQIALFVLGYNLKPSLMSFSLDVRKADDVVILDFKGRFTIGEPVETVRREVQRQLEEGARKFILNLRDLDFLDSSALGALVSAHTIIRNKNGEVKMLLRGS